jgi:hypothetical protein
MKNHYAKISDCLIRLKELRVNIEKSDPETRIRIKLESEILSKEISAIRLLQGHERIKNNLLITLISVIGGSGLITLIYRFIK